VLAADVADEGSSWLGVLSVWMAIEGLAKYSSTAPDIPAQFCLIITGAQQ